MNDHVELKAPSNLAFSLLAQQHSITLADQKSGLMLAAMTALLIFMAREVSMTGGLPDWWALSAAAFLVSTAVLNFITVKPTFVTTTSMALSFWRSPLFAKTREDFSREVLSKEFEAAHGGEDVLHLYALAKVNQKKYRYLGMAFITGPLGVTLFLAWRLGL